MTEELLMTEVSSTPSHVMKLKVSSTSLKSVSVSLLLSDCYTVRLNICMHCGRVDSTVLVLHMYDSMYTVSHKKHTGIVLVISYPKIN